METLPPNHHLTRLTLTDKSLGVLIGSALGDSIGLYTEFLPKTSCQSAYPNSTFTLLPLSSPTRFRADGHRDKFSPGDWTDDTDQALLIVLSYLHSYSQKNAILSRKSEGNDEGHLQNSHIDANDIAERISTWERQGLRALNRPPLGIGHTVGRVVRDADYLTSPVETATKIWIKMQRNAAPNGSLMRTHPLGVICMFGSEEDALRCAADVSRVTHVDPRCVLACGVQVALIRGILRGELRGEKDLDEVIERVWKWVVGDEMLRDPEKGFKAEEEDEMGWEKVDETLKEGSNGKGKTETQTQNKEGHPFLDREEYDTHCHAQTFASLQLDDSQKMGYVYKCLGTAILSLRMAMRREKASVLPVGTELFEEIITELIMEGGDADTNACVAGALLGAWLGYSRLPPQWERGLGNREWLLRKSQGVLYRVGILVDEDVDGGEGGRKWKDLVMDDPDTAIDGGKGVMGKEALEKMELDVLEMILLKQKARRDGLEKKEKKKGLGRWFGKDTRE